MQSAEVATTSAAQLEQELLLKEQNAQKLKEVEQQQEDFGEKKWSLIMKQHYETFVE